MILVLKSNKRLQCDQINIDYDKMETSKLVDIDKLRAILRNDIGYTNNPIFVRSQYIYAAPNEFATIKYIV